MDLNAAKLRAVVEDEALLDDYEITLEMWVMNSGDRETLAGELKAVVKAEREVVV